MERSKLRGIHPERLNDCAERIHFEVFHMTIEERRKSLQIKPDLSEDEPENPVKPGLPEDELDIPAYKRKGGKLKV
jgi:hypothetical protein